MPLWYVVINDGQQRGPSSENNFLTRRRKRAIHKGRSPENE